MYIKHIRSYVSLFPSNLFPKRECGPEGINSYILQTAPQQCVTYIHIIFVHETDRCLVPTRYITCKMAITDGKNVSLHEYIYISYMAMPFFILRLLCRQRKQARSFWNTTTYVPLVLARLACVFCVFFDASRSFVIVCTQRCIYHTPV